MDDNAAGQGVDLGGTNSGNTCQQRLRSTGIDLVLFYGGRADPQAARDVMNVVTHRTISILIEPRPCYAFITAK
jgi:hypothetical protein